MENSGRSRDKNSSRPPIEYLLTGILRKPFVGHKSSRKIRHGHKVLKRLKSQMSYADQKLYTSRQFAEGSNKSEEFFCYNSNDDSDDATGDEEKGNGEEASSSKTSLLFENVSVNIVDYITQRHLGNLSVNHPNILQPRIMGTSFNSQPDFSIKHLLVNGILQEKPIKVENLNKVFCSQWLSDKQTIFGTKCNKLIVLDVNTKHMTQIPSLNPSARSLPPDSQCGIHAIEVNPSKTLLATGGKNPNDVAVYKLPTMDPVCVGEMAHQDWVFGLAWINDEYFVSGSRDTSLAIWKVPAHEDLSLSETLKYSSSINSIKASVSSSLDHSYMRVPSHSYITAVSRKECKSAQKVRDVVFNRKLDEVACVSLNGYIHVWSTERFVQKFSRKLPFCLENVCLAVHEDYGLYAVGSKSHTTLLDCRTIQCVRKIASKYSGYGIRSANFYSTLLSIGTGQGTIMFYDLRAGKYLETYTSTARSATLKSSTGWTYPDEEIIMDVFRQRYTPAIYTHCIDMSGTRIFAAGGPLPITLCGNYIGLWH